MDRPSGTDRTSCRWPSPSRGDWAWWPWRSVGCEAIPRGIGSIVELPAIWPRPGGQPPDARAAWRQSSKAAGAGACDCGEWSTTGRPAVRGVARSASWPFFAVAGLAEELLFRGLIQAELGDWFSPAVGLVGASLLFGLAHPITLGYAVVVTLAGLIWGGFGSGRAICWFRS